MYPSIPPHPNNIAINPEGIEYLQRPWQRNKREVDLEAIYIFAKDYKVYINIGITYTTKGRFATVLDTGAGSNFIRLDEIFHRLHDKIEPFGDYVTVRNAIGKQFSLIGRIVLTVQIWNSIEKVCFFVADKLSTAVIWGCDYCDLHIDAIRTCLEIVRIDD